MTTEQLNRARAEAWHQAANPLLTADEAAAWLRETGVCFFLPRGQQLATAAPSFVEAVLGASQAAPGPEAIENATRLLERLLASGDAIALNLLGTPGEQPDFLATVETLPFLFALLGDKEWKRGPRGKSSPLVIEVWKLLDRAGPLTTIEVKDQLGRQLTEAAALRALTELWSHLRIEPVLKQGQPAVWQPLERSRQSQMQAGSTMSQAVALSALVSLYLQAAVAASADEIEVFLSPVASRSKVREVVRGLTATRQLSTLNLGPVEMFHVEGSLPEFPESAQMEAVIVESSTVETEADSGMGEGRRRFVAKRLEAEAGEALPAVKHPNERAPRRPRPAASDVAARPAVRAQDTSRPKPRPDQGGSERAPKDRRPFAPRAGTPGATRRPYGMRAPEGASSFHAREPWKEDRKPDAAREDAGSERRPFAKSSGEVAGREERRPFVARKEGEQRGEGKPFAPSAGDRPFKPRIGGKAFGERKSFGQRAGSRDGKPFASENRGERKPFSPREGSSGERKPFAPRAGGDRPSRPRSDAKAPGERRPFTTRKGSDRKPREGGSANRKPFAPGSGGDRAFKPRSDARPSGGRADFADRKPFRSPESGERKPFTPREDARGGFGPGAGARPFKPRAAGKAFGDRKPFSPGAGQGGKPPAPAAGRGKPYAEGDSARSFKPSSNARPFAKPKSFGDRKPTGEGRERRPFAPPSGDRPYKPRTNEGASGGSKSFGERKPFAPRAGGERYPAKPRDPAGKPFSPRGGSDARPPRPGPGSRPSTGSRPTPGSRPKPNSRPTPGESRSAGPRSTAGGARSIGEGARKTPGSRKTPVFERARTSPFTSSGKARSSVKPPVGRPGPRATRGGAAGARSSVKRTGRPGKGRGK